MSDTSNEQTDSLQSQLDAAVAESEKHKNEFLYLRAEFDTYRRNVIKERSDMMKYGSERLISELLTVIDNFERALETKITSENFEGFSKGVSLIEKELKSTLSKFGVSEVPCHGVAFDPAQHEALGAEPTSEVPDGHVHRVLRKPYKLHDKFLRPAQVIIGKSSN